jgi:hypothetical protein
MAVKQVIAFLVCILAGIGIGWYFGYTRPVANNQRELLKENQYITNHFHEFDLNVADFNQLNAKYFKIAKPWEESTASISLAALKNLKTNNMEGAEFRLASMVANYYRGHSRDGDTNLLTNIVIFAATDTVLSNAMNLR